MKNKVTIIIPTFNRAALIGETLDSIKLQSYQNWECIIVDDGSSDDSESVIKKYQENDNRFIFFSRPISKPKGANACRNIGLDKANGEYIVFFDSDDLMTPDHLETKVNGIQKYKCDYVITKTKFFNSDLDYMDHYYKYEKFEISPYNYIAQKINWVTLDICIKRELAQAIRFNEVLQSGQEYNYNCKLVHKSCNAVFIDKVVSLRRYHDNSIRTNLKSKRQKEESYFRASWYTFIDLETIADKKELKILLNRCVNLVYDSKSILATEKSTFFKAVFKVYKAKGIYFLGMFFGLKLFNKGGRFKKLLLR